MKFRNINKLMSAAMVALLLCSGCGGKVSTEVSGGSSSSSAVQSSEAEVSSNEEQEEKQENEITQAELNELFGKNVECMVNIFSINHLPYSGEPVEGDSIYIVSDDRFNSFSDFEEYVRSIYCTEEADRLLYNFPYEDSPMYVDVDGKLGVDLNYAGAKGYYVDWSNFEIEINSADGEKCTFTAKGVIEEPADVPVEEEYKSQGTAIYENGRWVLEEMMY